MSLEDVAATSRLADILTRVEQRLSVGQRGASSSPLLVGSTGYFLTGDDLVQVTTWCSDTSVVNVRVQGSFLHLDGRVEVFQERHTPNTDRSAVTVLYPRAPGWLQSVIVSTTNAPQRGALYARINIGRGQGNTLIPFSTLVQGYVTQQRRLSWPGAPPEDATAGMGAMRSVAGTNPAAGSQIVETVPTNARWRLRSILASLVTDATVATREVALTVDDGTTVYARFPATQTQIASLTRRYEFSAAKPFAAMAQDTTIPTMIGDLILPAGHRFATVVTNGVAGDDWGAPQYLVEEWLDP